MYALIRRLTRSTIQHACEAGECCSPCRSSCPQSLLFARTVARCFRRLPRLPVGDQGFGEGFAAVLAGSLSAVAVGLHRNAPMRAAALAPDATSRHDRADGRTHSAFESCARRAHRQSPPSRRCNARSEILTTRCFLDQNARSHTSINMRDAVFRMQKSSTHDGRTVLNTNAS